jgi:hypothetical protein
MKYILIGSVLVSFAFAQPVRTEDQPQTPVAGGSTLGVSVGVIQKLAHGWSIKKSALGEPVYNEQNEKIGKVEDVIIDPDKSLSYFIVSTGGFLGMAKHDVAIPVDQMKRESGKFTIPGATKDKLKNMAAFQYASTGKAD